MSPADPTLFDVLADRLGVSREDMEKALREARALTGLAAPDREATGLPCPHCGVALKRLDCDASTGVLFARVNMKVDTQANLRGLKSIITSLGERLPK